MVDGLRACGGFAAPLSQSRAADERASCSLGGLQAITGQLMLCYHADFQLIFGCTVLVEGPLEHQALHYGTAYCNTCVFCLPGFTLPVLTVLPYSSFQGCFVAGEEEQVKKI